MPLIIDVGLAMASGQRTTFVLDPLTLPDGRTLADWDSFVLTVREDPEFPRTGAALHTLKSADPIADGWEVVASSTDSDTAGDVLSVTLAEADATLDAGEKRYAFDIWAIGGSAGPVQLRKPTFLTVLPNLRE